MSASGILAIHAVIVDAKNNAAKRFYERFGFAPMQDDPMRLFLPLGSIHLQDPVSSRHENHCAEPAAPEVRATSFEPEIRFDDRERMRTLPGCVRKVCGGRRWPGLK